MTRKVATAALVVSLLSGRVSGQAFTPSIVACANSDGDTGYESIAEMNTDIQEELALLFTGKTPEASYEFVLCPNTALDMGNETLIPLLDNSMFLCGAQGTSTGCVLAGGELQVGIAEPIDPIHTMTSVSFIGISFQGFTEAAIAGDGIRNTTVTVSQSSFAVGTTPLAD